MRDKLRCPHCKKMFRPARSNQTLCDGCEKQERMARSAARANSGGAARPNAPSAAPVRVVSSAPPPDTGLYGAAAIREEQRREQQRHDDERHAQDQRLREQQRAHEQAQHSHDRHDTYAQRGQDVHHDQHGAHQHPQPHQGASGPRGVYGAHGASAPKQSARPNALHTPNAPRAERPAPAPRPPKQPRPAAPRFELTDDLRARIEARYLELAQPIEFDGIRTQIAAELSAPKSLVKRAVADLRVRMQLPSWWELQSYSGAEADLERIRRAYLPHLPVPDVGIHKTLAEALDLDPRAVYQGIRRIRAEMRLPQYNAPALHGDLPQPPPTPASADASDGASPVASATTVTAATNLPHVTSDDGGANTAMAE